MDSSRYACSSITSRARAASRLSLCCSSRERARPERSRLTRKYSRPVVVLSFVLTRSIVRIREHGLVQVGLTAGDPVEDVVSVAPGWGVGTAGEAAAAVSGDQG